MNKQDVAKHDRMVDLVDSMIDLHKKLRAVTIPNEKVVLERQIASTDHLALGRLDDRLVSVPQRNRAAAHAIFNEFIPEIWFLNHSSIKSS